MYYLFLLIIKLILSSFYIYKYNLLMGFLLIYYAINLDSILAIVYISIEKRFLYTKSIYIA